MYSITKVDDSVYDLEYMIHIDCSRLSEAEFGRMEVEMNELSITGNGYNVRAWNDSSGYDYWSDADNGTNYIQITAYIDDGVEVDMKQLTEDMERAMFALKHWSNT